MLQKVYISNKFCSLELYTHNRILKKKNVTVYKKKKNNNNK